MDMNHYEGGNTMPTGTYEVYCSSAAGPRLIATYKSLSAARVRCTDERDRNPELSWTIRRDGEIILYA